MAAPELIDTHVHLWDLERQPYPWVAEHPVLDQTHDIDRFDVERGEVPVERFVFVECTVSFDDEVAREEVRWAHALAERDARLGGIVAHASLEKGQNIRPHLEWLAEKPLVRGVRRLIQDEPDADFCLQFMDETDKVPISATCGRLVVVEWDRKVVREFGVGHTSISRHALAHF